MSNGGTLSFPPWHYEPVHQRGTAVSQRGRLDIYKKRKLLNLQGPPVSGWNTCSLRWIITRRVQGADFEIPLINLLPSSSIRSLVYFFSKKKKERESKYQWKEQRNLWEKWVMFGFKVLWRYLQSFWKVSRKGRKHIERGKKRRRRRR